MLRFNTFRARRYLRTKFVEGKFLLASEASDLELEIVDLLRTSVQSTMGDVALGDAWKVERLSDTEVLIKPGEAWFKGLPFNLRSGTDQLVTGAILTLGSTPVGVSAADDATGLGKVITFNDGSTTPTNDYRFVITAREELLTDIDDPFLKNANLSESTAQKVRLNFRLSIVPVSGQTESPIPYRDENSTSGGPVTNYPDAGNTADPNYVNQIVVSPTAAGNGELISLTPITGSEAIDGRDLEIVVRNDSGLGGGNPLPNSPTEQQAFANGKLIDSLGTEYHVNALFNDTISTQLVIRIDKEPNQPNPQLLNGTTYTVKKRDVYATDDVNGSPQGTIHWAIADLEWDSTSLVSHSSKLTDLRSVVDEKEDFQRRTNIKDNLFLTEGGDVSFDSSTGLLSWTNGFQVRHPFGTDNVIGVGSANMLVDASLVYELDLVSGGTISKGTTAVNITTGGTTITIDPITYTDISVGNVIVDSGGTIASISSIDPDTNQMIVNASLVTGAGTVFKDQYASGTAPLTSNTFTLATRSGNRVYFYRGLLELESGETNQIGDGASQQLFTFIGSSGESDDSPDYASEFYVTDGEDLVTAISNLDAGLDAVAGAVSAISWKAPVADFASLPAVGNSDGDVRLVLDTRVAYHWNDIGSEWLPLTGTGGGLKIIGGGTISWALGSSGVDTSSAQTGNVAFAFTPTPTAQNGQTFTTVAGGNLNSIDLDMRYAVSPLTGDIVIDIYNAPGGTPTGAAIGTSDDFDISALGAAYTTHNITFSSPVALSAATSYAFIVRDGTGTPSGSIDISRNTAGSYAGGNLYAYDGVTFTPVPAHDITPFAINVGSNSELSFTSDMFLEKAGLDYSDNTIPTSESPITLNADQDVAYVEPNLSTGGPNLSVTVDTLNNVPLTAIIVARRDGNDVIVGTSSSKLKNGESKELYEGLTDQERDKLYGLKSAFWRSDNPVIWTGTEIQFTTDLVLETLQANGTEQTYTVLAADSPIALTDGQYAYLTIDRTQTSQTLSLSVGAAPAEAAAGSEVVILAKRQDVTGVGYLHLPLHKQVLEPGQEVRLGASGSGGVLAEDLTAGENLSTLTAVYVSQGASDGGRTAGSVYTLDETNDDRIEFVGFTTEAGTTTNPVNVQFNGILDGFVGLTPGLPVYWVSGAVTQTVPTTANTWQITVGKALSTTEVLINPDLASSAIFITENVTTQTINNNQTTPLAITGFIFDGSITRSFTAEYFVNRTTDTNEAVESGVIRGVYATDAASWTISVGGVSGDGDVDFDITGSGQLTYTTGDLTGTGYAGEIKWAVVTTLGV